MPARLLALVASIAMVSGAVALRDRLDEDKEKAATVLRLVCATELGPACEAMAEDDDAGRLEVTVEPAGLTSDRLSGDDGAAAARELDGWLVTAPWPAIVAEASQRASRAPPVKAEQGMLARSPVVLAVWPERGNVLAKHCGVPAVSWRCLGDNAGRKWDELGGQATWGPLKPGHPNVSSATGLVVVGAATAEFFREAGGAIDLRDEGYLDWLTRLERSMPPSPSPLEDMLLRGPGAYDAVGTTEAEAGPLLARSARREKPQLIYPAPVATADVVLGTIPGPRAALITEVVGGSVGAKALAASGWRVQGQPRAKGVPSNPALPESSGLPAPGVLEALRTAVRETRP